MAFSHDLQCGPLIGSGFFGDVYEGLDPVHGKVAVKKLRPYPGERPSEWFARRGKLEAEASRLRLAEHDNVVRVYTLVRHTEDDDLLHMVMEFCEEGSLMNDYERGCMPLERVRLVLNDVCRGLHYIHSLSMVHRDIKPGNILGSNRRYKLGDFGLVSNNLVGIYASQEGYEDHMAPEVHKHNKTSALSDLWALGMTMYRLMHGQVFYQNNFVKETIPSQVAKGKFAARLPWLPHIPQAWQKFIRKAMHDDPSHRFRTALEMSQKAIDLPAAPDWQCTFTPERTEWTRYRGERKIQVVLESTGRGHQWYATSIGGERNRRLANSKGLVSRDQAMIELSDYLTNQ